MNGYVYVQLGWLSRAVEYCYSHAIEPVFNALINLIGTIQRIMFENVLLPILQAALSVQVELVKAILSNIIYNMLFKVMNILLKVLDAIEGTFRTFAGLNPVFIWDQSTGEMRKGNSLLVELFRTDHVQHILLFMIMTAFALTFLVSIVATIKSIGDFGEHRPVNKVLRLMGRALGRLILIPFISLFLVVLGDQLLKAIDVATNAARAPVSNIVFTMSTLDAV